MLSITTYLLAFLMHFLILRLFDLLSDLVFEFSHCFREFVLIVKRITSCLKTKLSKAELLRLGGIMTVFGNSNGVSNEQPSLAKSSITGSPGKTYSATPAEQSKFVEDCRDQGLIVGDKWYLISSHWFLKWAQYTGFSLNQDGENEAMSNSVQNSIAPGPINNESIRDGNSLRKEILEEIDYFTIPEKVWNYLVNLYQIKSKEVSILFWTHHEYSNGIFY